MSTALAIAATTEVLRSILADRLGSANLGFALGNPPVTALPPDRIATGANDPSQLNLFLYQVTPNPGWRNTGLPARTGNGNRVDNPPLAIDLHYLLSAYGQGDLMAEVLLGIGMQVLHEFPVLSRSLIRATLDPASPDPLVQKLATAELADQEEQIRVTQETLSIEDLSKLWSVFGEKYRPGAAYLATTILIRSGGGTSEGPPVRDFRVKVMPLRTPTITGIDPQVVTPGPNARLTLLGYDLLAENTKVRFGTGDEEDPVAGESSPFRVVVDLPETLRAGVNTVHIVQYLHFAPDNDDPAHRGFEGNVAAFMVRPQIAKQPGNGDQYAITLTDTEISPGGAISGTITVTLARPVGRTQRVSLLLNERNPPQDRPGHRHTFNAPSRATAAEEETTVIAFAVGGLVAGEHLVRVRVDGAESDLDVDGAGAYSGPGIVIQ